MPLGQNDLLGIVNPNYSLIPETLSANNLLGPVSPRQLHRAYSNKTLRGVIVNDPEAPWYVRKAAQYDLSALTDLRDGPLIWEETEEYKRIKALKRAVDIVMQWQDYLRINPRNAMKGNQLTGDCVSWAIRVVLELLRSMRISRGEWEAYILRQATCGIYSGRGHTGEGANPGRLSEFATVIGFLLETTYLDGKYDFTDYEKYVRWGMQRGRQGMPNDLLEVTSKNKCAKTYLVKTTDGIKTAFDGGHVVHCGSMIGVSSSGDPVSRLQGSWAHDMGLMGYDFTKEYVRDEVFFWDQSWGDWNRLTNIPDAWKPWPQGGFAITERDTQQAVRADGTWVFVYEETNGFPADPIDNNLLLN